MLRYFTPFVNKLKVRWPAVWARLPGIGDTVRTSLVYAAVTALFVVLSSSLLLYQSWRQYGSLRGGPPQGAAVQEKLSTAVGGDGAIQVAGGQTENPAQPGQRAAEEQTAALNNLWAAARSEEMQRPLPGKIITAYGWQENTIHKDWRFNAGVDVEPEKGDAVKAVKSGKVKEVSANSRGTQLKIDHGGGTVTSYGNLADCRVQDGQLVKQGAIIGSLGRDNRVLHFEIWQDGRSRDPGELWNGE